MRSRSAPSGSGDGVEVASEAVPISNKRPYNRKSMLCRLCLRVLPKEELSDIFAQKSSMQKAIRTAVNVEVNRKDRSIRICHCCLDLVHLINVFRGVCEQTELLLSQNVEISNVPFWSQDCDQKTFGKSLALVEQCRIAVDKLFEDRSLVYCEVQPEQLIDESTDLPEVPVEENEPNVEQDSNIEEDIAVLENEEYQIEIEPSVVKEEYVEQSKSLKSEIESDADFSEVDSNDPDYEQEVLPEKTVRVKKEKDTELVSQTARKKKDPADPPRRRGRPALPESMLKRRRRKPGEPKMKPGPKNRIKLPPQSVCEICGMLVNRENQERHRNEHLGNRPYGCTVEGCSHSFSSKAGLHGHLARHADRNNVYDCDICGAKIKTKSSLHRHRKMHTTEKPHACTICGKRFWRKSYLNHHATVHTGIAKFPCEYCGFVFKNKYWRSFHIKQKHVSKGEVPKYETQEELDENDEIPEGLVSEAEMEYP